jgi:glycosyltransferase involved in cell wall biosynthesis
MKWENVGPAPRRRAPRVSLGLPVYNGESFVRQALDSILAQTFADFDLVISDNASTDSTPEICKAYEAGDPRIRYFRNESNRGVAWNHNRVFELSTGEYFKWCAADDVLAPDYLAMCVDGLEARPDAVLCYSDAIVIDECGEPVEVEKKTVRIRDLPLASPDPVTRFSSLLSPIPTTIIPFYAVMRSQALRRTRLHGNYLAGDRCLLAELSLLGPFVRVPDVLFYRRRGVKNRKDWNTDEMLLYAPSRPERFAVREWRVAIEHLVSIRRAPVNPGLKVKLVQAWLRWLVDARVALHQEVKELVKDVVRHSLGGMRR